ncbi:MAG TPA: hypothetical protein DHV62_06770 [Elusimicrobia bacterium]|nr:hypothetical protein [Elusimicrobiota bacterium]
MKWFKHDCDMHTDLKIQSLLEKYGLEGYALWNLCLELLGKEGHKGRLNTKSGWKNALLKISGWSANGKIDEILNVMGELSLICPKSLKCGNLYIPKFIKRTDDYTQRKLRTNSEQSTDNVRVDKNRIDKIRTEYIKIKGLDINNFSIDDFSRTAKAIKTLLIKSKFKDDLVIRSIEWASRQKWCDWTLETIIRRWPDYMVIYKPKPEPKPDPNCDICFGKGKIPDGQLKGAVCNCVKVR